MQKTTTTTNDSRAFYAGLAAGYAKKLETETRRAFVTGNFERVARMQAQLDRARRLAGE